MSCKWSGSLVMFLLVNIMSRPPIQTKLKQNKNKQVSKNRLHNHSTQHSHYKHHFHIPGRNGNEECNNLIGNVKGRNNALKIIKLVILEEGDWDVRGLGEFSLGPPPNLFFMSHPFYVIVSANNPLLSS